MNAARTEQPPPPGDDNADRDRKLALEMMTTMQRYVAELQADTTIRIANLQAENWRLIQAIAARDANAPPELYVPLKAAAIEVVGIREADYERVRKWCELGKIIAEKRDGQWWVQMNSLMDYAAARGVAV